jgi:thiol:disulfide interchange protein DsbA
MKRIISLLTLCLLALPLVASAQAAQFQEGRDYQVIEQTAGYQPVDGIEVTEAFSYLCSHCATFDPYVSAWKERMPEGVVFQRIPVEFGRPNWSLYARAYVTASVMGIAEESHPAMMDALWKEKRQMRNMDQLADFYAGFGVDKAKFLSTAQSFAVDWRRRREHMVALCWGVNATPTMVVKGNYRVTANVFDSTVAVVVYLVAR